MLAVTIGSKPCDNVKPCFATGDKIQDYTRDYFAYDLCNDVKQQLIGGKTATCP